MKIYIILFCFLIFKVSIVCAQTKETNPSIISDSLIFSPCLNKKFPDFSHTNLCGVQITQKDLLNKITLIDFWFTSCSPCITEIKSLKNIYETFRTEKKFQLVSFAWETPDNAIITKNSYSIPYSIIPINSEESIKLNCDNGFPVLMIVNEEGEIIFLKSGGPIDESKATEFGNDTLIPLLRQLLNKIN